MDILGVKGRFGVEIVETVGERRVSLDRESLREEEGRSSVTLGLGDSIDTEGGALECERMIEEEE